MVQRSIRDYIDLAPQTAINSALRIDAEVLSSNPQKYIEENRFSYTVAMNTWLYLIREYSQYGWLDVLQACSQQGLQKTVLECCDCAQSLIDSITYGTPWVNDVYSLQMNILSDVALLRTGIALAYDGTQEIGADIMQTFLVLMRYLKRMTPLHADALDKKAIDSFIAAQNRQKLRDRRDPDPIFIELVKRELPKGLIKKRVSAFNKIRLCDIEFTPGVAYNATSKLMSKLEAINKLCPQYFDNQLSSLNYREVIQYQRELEDRNMTRMVSVPKSFKIGRTIAMEDTFRQSVSRRMFSLTDKLLPGGIDLHDQSRNQKYAASGSIDGTWATIDLSHASDDVTKTLVSLLYPYEYVKHLDAIAPTHTVVPGGKVITLTSWATMGNSMTFVNECEVFWAICRAAVHFHQRHFGDVDDTVIVYGDDIIVDSRAYDSVVAFLQYFGFIVNTDKSYATGKYRESCGKEYYDGKEISSIYYPRFPVTPNEVVSYDGFKREYSTSLQRLITLQHRLWYVSKGAAHYIEHVLLSIQPKLCYCNPGDDSADLYGYRNTYSQVRKLATYDIVDEKIDHLYWYEHRSSFHKLDGGSVKQQWQVSDWEDPRNRFMKWREKPTFDNLPMDNALYRRYLYQEFLRNGPRYESELDRLLGISAPFSAPFTGKPHYTWGHELS